VQLLTLFRATALPRVRITDWPDLRNRGFMLDVSRDKVGSLPGWDPGGGDGAGGACPAKLMCVFGPQVPAMETLFGLVDLMEVLKYNQLQLYMEHTFQYSEHRCGL
jgi:hexosaminidase